MSYFIPDTGTLRQLEWLEVTFSGQQLAPLSGLTRLRTLYLMGENTTDLAPLATLRRLQHLHLVTAASDLGALASLTNLRELRLFSKATNMTPLARLTRMQPLSLGDSGVTDLSAIAAMKDPRQLDLRDTAVSDLTPLAGLQRLQALWLGGSNIDDSTMAILRALPALVHLDLSGTAVSQQQLTLFRNQRPNEPSIFVKHASWSIRPGRLNQPRSRRCSRHLGQKLRRIGAALTTRHRPLRHPRQPHRWCQPTARFDRAATCGHHREQPGALRRLKSLSTLDVSHTRVSDLRPLANLTSLNRLLLRDTAVRDIAPLRHLPQLMDLDLGYTRIRDLRPLHKLHQLRIVNLEVTPTVVTQAKKSTSRNRFFLLRWW